MKNRTRQLTARLGLCLSLCLACILLISACLAETIWTTTPPNDEYITKTQYRSRTKLTTTANTTTLDGWTLYNTTYGDWGVWTEWSTNVATASATRSVESNVVTTPAVTKTIYKYNHYKYYVPSQGLYYYSYGSTFATNNGYSGTWEYLSLDSPLAQSNSFDGQAAYLYNNAYWFNYSTSVQTVTAAVSTTYYRYRDRPVVCQFYQWSSWSAWQDATITATADKEVESRTVYALSGESKWSTTIPSDPYITMTQYRSRDKSYTTNSSPTLSGWTQYSQSYSAYGSWSAWSTTAVTSSNTRNVETKVETTPAVTKTVHKYNHYKYYVASQGLYYYSYGSTFAINNGYPGVWEDITLDSALSQSDTFDGQAAYLYANAYWFNHTTSVVTVTPEISTTYYRYQDRTIIYHFYQWGAWSDWQDSVITSTSDREVETRTLYAVDETKIVHALTVQSSTGGVTNISTATYMPGVNVTLVATPVEDYRFSTWRTNNNGVFANALSSNTTFTMPANDVTIFADFAPSPTYTLSTQCGIGGRILINSSENASAVFCSGKRIALNAIAELGYDFIGWSSNNGSSFDDTNADQTYVTMPARETVIYASFRPIVYHLTAQSSMGGQIVVSGTGFTYGTSVTVQAMPSDGYTFAGWISSEAAFADASAPTTSFNMPNSAVTIRAMFEATPKSIEFGYTDIPMIVGSGCQLGFATDAGSIAWTSSNPAVASVGNFGFVTAHAIGEATITVSIPDTDILVSSKVIVKDWVELHTPTALQTIGEEALQNTTFELVDLSKSNAVSIADRAFANCANLRIVKTGSQLTSISPTAFASLDNVVFACDREGYASRFAASNGIPYYIMGDEANYVAAQNVALDSASLEMRTGASSLLLATVSPENATNKRIFWASSNPTVASVRNGQVNALSIGTTSITATCMDGSGKSATCAVEVVQPKVERISVPVTMDINVGASADAYANTLPTDAVATALQWTTSDSSVVSITEVRDEGRHGILYGEAEGTAAVTVSTTDGRDITASFVVTVNSVKVTDLTLNRSNASLKVDATTRVEASVLPVDATDNTLTWASDNPNIATVLDGTVTGVSTGTARITVTTNDGSNLCAYCDVAVEPNVILLDTLTISQPTATIAYGGSLQLSCYTAPANATDSATTWNSNNTSVATVSNGGLVTAKSAGTTVVTVTNGRLNSSCTVTVSPPPEIPPTAIAINPINSIAAGGSVMMSVSYFPSNTTKAGVRWDVTNLDFCNIDANSGKLTAVPCVPYDMTVTVTATSTFDSRIKSTTTVAIKATPVSLAGAYSIIPYGASDYYLNMKGSGEGYGVVAYRPCYNSAEQTFVLLPRVSNIYGVRTENYSGRYIHQSGSNAAGNVGDYNIYIGCIAHNTYIFKNFGGEALTRAQNPTISSQSANYLVSWEPYDSNNTRQRWNLTPVNYSLSLGNATISVGGTAQLNATFTRNGVTQTSDFFFGGASGWKSSDTSKVTVDQSGKVIGVSAGSSTISATSACGRAMSCTVTVNVGHSYTGVKVRMDALRNSKFPNYRFWNHLVTADANNGDNLYANWDESYSEIVTSVPCATHYGKANIGQYDCNFFDGGIQCFGFAGRVFYDVFGVRKSALGWRYDLENLQVGDFVGLNNCGHYAVVYSRNGNTFTCAEANFAPAGSSYNCQIRWGDVTYNLSNIVYFIRASNYDEINQQRVILPPGVVSN